MMNATERVTAIAAMKAASDIFYAGAVRIGNHPFIEFCGLMNEYIKACESAHKAGIDFSECSAHSGQPLPMESYMIDYVNEKLHCIFTGRCAWLTPNVELSGDFGTPGTPDPMLG